MAEKIDIELILLRMNLTEEKRPDSGLPNIAATAGLDLKDYFPCPIDLFRDSEIKEVMNPIATFGSALLNGGGKSVLVSPIEGVFEFKRLEAYKYIRYSVDLGHYPRMIEYVLVPVDSPKKNTFFDYLINEVADLEHGTRKCSEPKNYLDRLFLQSDIKDSLIGQIEVFLENRDFYSKHKMPWKFGILLYGPPGNGKTLFIKAVGEYFDLDTRDLSEQVMFGKLRIPESEKINQEGFVLNRYDCYTMVYGENPRPRLYYLEDMDKKLPSRRSDIPDMSANDLLQTLDGVKEIDNVIVIGTTNYLEDLIAAFVARPGRFDIVQEIGPPDENQVKAILDYYEFKVDDQTALLKRLAGCSMAFVENLIKVCIMTHKRTEFEMKEIEKILGSIESHVKLEEMLKKSYEAKTRFFDS